MTRRIEPHMPPPLTDWSAAKCHNDPDMHPEDFFPVQFYREGLPLPHTLYLRAYCRTCPLIEACLDDAIDKRDDYGFRGGTTPDERAAIRRRRGREQAAIRHGTSAGFAAHKRRDEEPCTPCRQARNADRRQEYRDRKEKANA